MRKQNTTPAFYKYRNCKNVYVNVIIVWYQCKCKLMSLTDNNTNICGQLNFGLILSILLEIHIIKCEIKLLKNTFNFIDIYKINVHI